MAGTCELIVPMLEHRFSEEQLLIGRLDRLAKWARRAGWFDAAKLLGGLLAERRKTERERSWDLGRCIWCEIDANRLREAVVYDPSGGPAMCWAHFDEMTGDLDVAGNA
jgi:hypothetical protein